MLEAQPCYEELLRVFRAEIDAHLHWQDAQAYHGLLKADPGLKMTAFTVYEEMRKLRNEGRIRSPKFAQAVDTLYGLYAY